MIPIAAPVPVAGTSTSRRIRRLIRSARRLGSVVRGIKRVQRAIVEGRNGIAVFSADTTPMDLIIHLPAMCEEKRIPYIFVEDRHVMDDATVGGNGNVSCCFVFTDSNLNNARVKKVVKYARVGPPVEE